ncbi:MAG TPA: chloride channel protein [Thermoplasmata archaeon]|nr:chloride channel protein [Thermoplasmata archaeon]
MGTSRRWYRFVDQHAGQFVPTSFRDFVLKWVPLSLLIGIAVGVMTVLFRFALDVVAAAFNPSFVPWYLVFLLPTAGGALVGLIIPHFAKETAGQGMDEVIHAIHYRGGQIRSIVPPVKLIVSALTISSGGSAGPEGPVGEIGAGTASLFGRLLRLRRSDARTLVIAGAAAGFGAIFKAPLGGALFALETPYKNDLEHSAVIPALISSTVSYLVFVLVYGAAPIFGGASAQPRFDLAHLGLYLSLGLLSGVLAIVFVRAFFAISDAFSRSHLPFIAKTTLGGLACGLIAIAFPAVLGLGYFWDSSLLTANFSAVIVAGTTVTGLAVLLLALGAILFAKIVATSFTIGSGGSGGVLTPSLFIGGTLGAVVGLFLQFLNFPFSPPVLVLVGMGAVLAAATKTPISSAVMLTEMTGGFAVIIPLILATVASYAIAGEHTLYPAQITRQAMPLDLGALAGKRVKEVMTAPVVVFPPETSVADALQRTDTKGHYSYPVVGPDGTILGVVYRRGLREAAERTPTTPVRQIMESHFEAIHEDVPAERAFDLMNELQVTRMFVTDGSKRVVGMLTQLDLMRAADEAEPSA